MRPASTALVFVAASSLAAAPIASAVCDVGVAFPDESVAPLDADGDGLWGLPGDRIARIAVYAGPGEIFLGDWNGDGVEELAKLLLVPDGGGADAPRPYFYVDFNGSGDWEGTTGGDRWGNFLGSTFAAGGLGDPATFAGLSWDRGDVDVVAYYAPENQWFVVDLNGTVTWNGFGGGDLQFRFAAFAGPGKPVLGDWDGDGDTDAGLVVGSRFVLDRNGNRQWDGNAGGDRNTSFAASFSGQPIAGDWDGDGGDEIGLFVAPGTFLLDANDNGVWDGKTGGDVNVGFGGTDLASEPLVCDWNGDGADDVGVATSALVFRIDIDGDRVYGPGDRSLPFTPTGQGPAQPIAGAWLLPSP